MKIKEFLIKRYGPLSHKNPVKLSDFNILWGRNEEGKTLTIDALVKFLLGKKYKNKRKKPIFEKIDRVEEFPEGYAVIETNNKEYKLGDRHDLLSLRKDLSDREFRNIFVIRNSDLSLYSESSFYSSMIDKLTGMRTRDIENLKALVKSISGLTPRGDFKNDDSSNKLKDRLQKARKLIEDIKSLKKKVKEKKWNKLEYEKVKLEEEIDEIKKKLDDLQAALKKEKYTKGKALLEELEDVIYKLKSLDNIDDKTLKEWNEIEKEMYALFEKYQEKDAQRARLKEQREKVEAKIKEIREKLKIADSKRFQIEKLIDDIKSYEVLKETYNPRIEKGKIYMPVMIFSFILTIISFFALLLLRNYVILGTTIVFLALAIVFSVLAMGVRDMKAQIERGKRLIMNKAKRLNLEGKEIDEVHAELEKFEIEYNSHREDLNVHEREATRISDELRKLREEELPEISTALQNANNKLEELKKKCQVESKKDLEEKVNKKKELEKRLEKIQGELTGILGSIPQEKNPEEILTEWSAKLREYEEYRDFSLDLTYDEKKEDKLRKELKSKEEALEALRKELELFRDELKEVQRRAMEILLEEVTSCSFEHLDAVSRKLDEFIKTQEKLRENALLSEEILSEIEMEEKEQFTFLFGKDSQVSLLFKEVTEGMYEEVKYDKDENKIYVRNKDGEWLDTDKLSGGTFDQLYFVIRVALGENLLRDEKGFFILDDPFVKSDPERLNKQINMLRKIIDSGWQILYFSCKGEVKELLKKDIKEGKVQYIEVALKQ